MRDRGTLVLLCTRETLFFPVFRPARFVRFSLCLQGQVEPGLYLIRSFTAS